MDNELHKLKILQPCFIDDLDCFNFRKYMAQTNAVYTTIESGMAGGTNDAGFHLTTSKLNPNPNIEENLTDYVNNHMYDMLQENQYHLFLSGGIDSENIANIFLQCNINFTPVIVSYIHDNKVLNDYDIAYAYKFCKTNNLTPLVIDIDIIDFYTSGTFRKYAFEYQCESPQFAPILYAFDKIDGNIIYSGHQKIFTNLVYRAREESTNFKDIVDSYEFNGDPKNDINFMEKFPTFFVFDKVLNKRNDNSISDFYNFNTDICLTATNNFIKNTDVTYNQLLEYNGWQIKKNKLLWQQEWKNSEQNVINSREFKNRNLKKKRYNFKVNNLYYPNNLMAPPRPKYTGFEGVKKFYSDKYIGKDLLLKEFDKHFRQTLTRAIVVR